MHKADWAQTPKRVRLLAVWSIAVWSVLLYCVSIYSMFPGNDMFVQQVSWKIFSCLSVLWCWNNDKRKDNKKATYSQTKYTFSVAFYTYAKEFVYIMYRLQYTDYTKTNPIYPSFHPTPNNSLEINNILISLIKTSLVHKRLLMAIHNKKTCSNFWKVSSNRIISCRETILSQT